MSTSRDDERLLDTLFEEAREAPRPEDLRRVEDGLRDWLAPDREPVSPSALQRQWAPSARALKAAAVVVAVAGLVGVGVLSQTFRGRSAHRGASPESAASVVALEPSAPAPVPEMSVAVADLPSVPEAPQPPPTTPARSTPNRPRVVQVAPSVPAVEMGAGEAAEMKESESEASFLRRTRAALVEDPARALRMTDEHASRYPRGVLLQERDVIAIDALVRLGRRDEARARATAFNAKYPSSAHASHLAAIVETERK
jgi:hypothetical protein